MVPTSASCGRSTRAGFGAGGALASGNTVAGGGGRRDDEKIGRSRVLDKVASGIAQSGLALGARGIAATGGCAGLTTTAGAAAAGKSWDEDPGSILASSGVSASSSDKSLGSAEVGAATPSDIVSNSVSRMAGLRIISAAVMSYRHHPETAPGMRRVPTPDTAKPPDRPRHCTHFIRDKGQIQPVNFVFGPREMVFAKLLGSREHACRVTKPFEPERDRTRLLSNSPTTVKNLSD
jgi:hypothetical protein